MKSEMTAGMRRFYLFIMSSFFILFLSLIAVGEQCDPATVVLDGQAVFPLGWYSLNGSEWEPTLDTTPLDESNQHDFDFVMLYYPFRCSDVAVLAYMDDAQTRGVKILFDLHDCDLTELQRRVNLVKSHQALYGYYLDDEPEIRGISAAEIISRYNAVKQIDSDPNHPVVLTFYNALASTQAYLPGADIVVRELYTTSRVRDTVRSDVAIARNAGKGYLAAPGTYQTENRTLPSAADMRFAFLAPVAAGTGGFMPFIFQGHVGYDPGPPAEGFRDEIVYPFTDVIRSIAPLLITGDNGLNVTSQYANSTYMYFWENDVAWIIAGDADDAVIVAANFGPSSTYCDVDFTIAGLDTSIVTGEVLGENRIVSLDSSGTFKDSFDAADVHVYRFTKDTSITPIFSDDFERIDADTLGANWVETAPFGIRSGNVVNVFTTGSWYEYATVNGFTMSPNMIYTMKTTMFIQRISQFAGVVWCYEDADNTYLLRFNQEGTVQFFRYDDGVSALLVNTTHGFTIPDNSEIPVLVEVEFDDSGNFEITLTQTQSGNTKTITYVDATPLTSGSCGIMGWPPGAAYRYQWLDFTLCSLRVQSPVFSPDEGVLISGPTAITITCFTAGASIYYTTDGSTPSDTNGTLYTAAVTVNPGDTLKAIAVKSGYGDSEVISRIYLYPQASAPIFTPDDGYISDPTAITIKSVTPGASIYYTTDGTIPTISSMPYSNPVTVSAGTTLKAIATAVNHRASVITSRTYINLTVIEGKSGRIDTTPNGSLDLLFHNGNAHVNGNVYKKIVLTGTVSNWIGYTAVDLTGTWAFISLIGSDYFINRDVPTVVDETMNVFSYLGDMDYGDDVKQRGFAANSGFIFFKGEGDGDDEFIAEDCCLETGGEGHRLEVGEAILTNPTQFVYEIVYDLDVMAMIVKIKDIGDAEWDSQMTVALGLRNVAGYDDWSDLVMSVQMADNLSARSTTYGFDYTIQMSVGNMQAGDANFDGMVDVGDLGILAANYGTTSGATWAQGDFNNDGAVDVGDLGILAANYGSGASSTVNFDADYAKVFGDIIADNDEVGGSLCSGLGLSLIAGLILIGLMLVKLEN